jgi:hypothetical protein
MPEERLVRRDFEIPALLEKELLAYCSRTGASKNEVLKEALERFFRSNPGFAQGLDHALDS